jgi:glycosyltransferase involved in cell wall biosynthesis
VGLTYDKLTLSFMSVFQMKTMIVHNNYQIAGGEDSVVASECALLKARGNDVELCRINNDGINNVFDKILTAIGVVFSINQYVKFRKLFKLEKPDLVHVHNYFPLISPAIFYACNQTKTPVVHTLHNYRAVCPTALLMHDGLVNEKNIHSSSWWTVFEKVYRGSFFGSLSLACMVEYHKLVGTWHTKVDRFIALTEFSKAKYIEAGWPEHKICVKPNFIEDPFNGRTPIIKKEGYALFVGRLSKEKGLNTLINGWGNTGILLKIIGEGPLLDLVESVPDDNVEYLGKKDKQEVLKLIQHSEFIIMPSTWYEGFPMVLAEAFACGTPALVSRLGSMQEIVGDGVTGLHFEAGNSNDMAEKAKWMFDNIEDVRTMGRNAREEYLAKYSPEKNYEILMEIYRQAIEEAKKQ